MRSVQVLSGLALRRLLNGSRPGEASANMQPEAGHHVARALRQANARAWFGIEILLAGEALWECAQLTWERSLEVEFFQPLRRFLDTVSLSSSSDPQADFRRGALLSLRAALGSGLLTSGPLDLVELLLDCNKGDTGDAQCDWRALGRLCDHLDQAGYAELRPLIELRAGANASLLVVLVAALFRQAIQADADLFGDLASGLIATVPSAGGDDFRAVALMLERHRSRFDSLLASLHETKGGASQPVAVDPAAGANRLERGFACAQRREYDQAIGEFTAALQLDPSSAQAFLHRGDAHRLKGDYVQALVDYSAAVRQDPSNALALIQRGQVHWLTGQNKEAVADFTAALQIDAKSALAYHYRGKALADAGEPDAAIVNFSEALRLDPYFTWAYHDSGEAHAAKGNFDLAIADYSEAIRLNPLSTLSYLRRGSAYAAMGDFDRANADYGNALRLDPHHVAAYQARGIAFRKQGKYEQAAEEFTRALELDFNNGHLYYERGLLLQLQGNHSRALLDFNAAVVRNSRDAEMYFRRGVTYDALGDDERALADLSQAIRIKPDYAAAYNQRGLVYMNRNEPDLAFADFTDALRLAPALTDAFVNRARVQSRTGKLDEALADCEQAIRQDPNLATTFLVRGSILGQKSNYREAVKDFSRALRLGPHSSQAYFLRGVAHLKQNNPRQAVADLTEAIRLNPNNARAYSQRAAIRLAAGHSGLALDDLAHAARIDLQFAAAYCSQLGAFHAAQGKNERAVTDYTIALFLDPNNAATRSAREQAWKAYLGRPRKTLKAPRAFNGVIPPLPQANGADSTSASLPSDESSVPTNESVLDQETDDDMSGVSGPDTPRPSPPGTSEHALETDTGFELNIPGPDVSSREPNVGETSPAIAEASATQTQGFTVQDTPEEYQKEQEALKQKAEDRAREEAERINNVRLAVAEEERKKKQALREKVRKRVPRDEDDEGRLALWKKGILVAASLLALYVIVPRAWGFLTRNNWKPSTVNLTGKVLDADGSPLPNVDVRFHPLDPPGVPGWAATKEDGSFRLSSLGTEDGICPGRYVVTIRPIGRKSAPFLPALYGSADSSPLKVEVETGADLAPFKIKL